MTKSQRKQRARQSRQYNKYIGYLGPETERCVDIDSLDIGEISRSRIEPKSYRRSKGQVLVIISLMMTVLILFVGLGVDVGNMMGKRAKLQSAVDSAVLSAAQLLSDPAVLTPTVVTKTYQILEANGIPTNTLTVKVVTVDKVASQVHLSAVQNVDTFFMRIVPMWRTVQVSANATADISSFAEMNTKPYGQPGVVSELNLSVWGVNSYRKGGDAYSPSNITLGTVSEMSKTLPYGYLFRIDVPPSYADDEVWVQLWDPDTYNRPDAPPTPPTPQPTVCAGPGTPCSTPVPTATPANGNDGRYTWCTNNPLDPLCSTYLIDKNGNNQRYQPGENRNAYKGAPQFSTGNRVGFWRVDEFRRPYTTSSDDSYIDPCKLQPSPCTTGYQGSYATTTSYSLWHFNPHITSAFGDPNVMSDAVAGAALPVTYTVGVDARTDLRWYMPQGFRIKLYNNADPTCNHGTLANECFERETNGSFYFYMYVHGDNGSSENNWDVRVGPSTNGSQYRCDDISAPFPGPNPLCYPNEQYFRQVRGTPIPDWSDNSGGTSATEVRVFAKRAMVLNLDTGDFFSMLFTQVSKNASGQTLTVKHFDQDCTPNCGLAFTNVYQMQYCKDNGGGNYAPCSNVNDPTCFGDLDPSNILTTDYIGPNNFWYCAIGWCGGFTVPGPGRVRIPVEGTSDYTQFFGPAGQCASSWLRLKKDWSYSNDTTTWEMPFNRPRLVK